MVGEGFLTTLKKSLAEGKITQAEIDMAAKRILDSRNMIWDYLMILTVTVMQN